MGGHGGLNGFGIWGSGGEKVREKSAGGGPGPFCRPIQLQLESTQKKSAFSNAPHNKPMKNCG